jgi:hypothetical protein
MKAMRLFGIAIDVFRLAVVRHFGENKSDGDFRVGIVRRFPNVDTGCRGEQNGERDGAKVYLGAICEIGCESPY